jgi:hypothetical protein
MSSSSYIRHQIDALAVRLKLMAGLGGYDYTDDQLRAEAARQVAQEQRELRAQRTYAPPAPGRVTLDNVKALFAARVAAIAARMRDPRTQPPVTLEHATPSPPPAPVERAKSRVQGYPVNSRDQTPDPDRHATLGVFSGHPSSAELIDDREFHNSVRYGDTATDNWRRSIQVNEEIAAQRSSRSRWIG